MAAKLTKPERSEFTSLLRSTVPLWGRGERNEPIFDYNTTVWLERGLVRIVTERGRVGFRLTEAGRASLRSAGVELIDVESS